MKSDFDISNISSCKDASSKDETRHLASAVHCSSAVAENGCLRKRRSSLYRLKL